MPFTLRGKILIQKCWTHIVESDNSKLVRKELQSKYSKEETKNFVTSPEGYEICTKKPRLKSLHPEEEINSLVTSLEDYENCNSKHGQEISYPKAGINNIAPLEAGYTSSFKTKPNKTKRRLEWDEELPDSIKKEFQEWIDDIPEVAKQTFPRYIFCDEDGEYLNPPPKTTWELHGFVDAGKYSWGVAIYLRYPLPNGKFRCVLIFSTSRVAPTKQELSVPRKELNSIVLGAKNLIEMSETLCIPISNTTIHTDSLICLYWLKKSSKSLGVYVWNRVKYVQETQIEVL